MKTVDHYAGLLADLRTDWPDDQQTQREICEHAARVIARLCGRLDAANARAERTEALRIAALESAEKLEMALEHETARVVELERNEQVEA